MASVKEAIQSAYAGLLADSALLQESEELQASIEQYKNFLKNCIPFLEAIDPFRAKVTNIINARKDRPLSETLEQFFAIKNDYTTLLSQLKNLLDMLVERFENDDNFKNCCPSQFDKYRILGDRYIQNIDIVVDEIMAASQDNNYDRSLNRIKSYQGHLESLILFLGTTLTYSLCLFKNKFCQDATAKQEIEYYLQVQAEFRTGLLQQLRSLAESLYNNTVTYKERQIPLSNLKYKQNDPDKDNASCKIL